MITLWYSRVIGAMSVWIRPPVRILHNAQLHANRPRRFPGPSCVAGSVMYTKALRHQHGSRYLRLALVPLALGEGFVDLGQGELVGDYALEGQAVLVADQEV